MRIFATIFRFGSSLTLCCQDKFGELRNGNFIDPNNLISELFCVLLFSEVITSEDVLIILTYIAFCVYFI